MGFDSYLDSLVGVDNSYSDVETQVTGDSQPDGLVFANYPEEAAEMECEIATGETDDAIGTSHIKISETEKHSEEHDKSYDVN